MILATPHSHIVLLRIYASVGGAIYDTGQGSPYYTSISLVVFLESSPRLNKFQEQLIRRSQ
jgi:hypothetical protein